jgi:hypothetical protein
VSAQARASHPGRVDAGRHRQANDGALEESLELLLLSTQEETDKRICPVKFTTSASNEKNNSQHPNYRQPSHDRKQSTCLTQEKFKLLNDLQMINRRIRINKTVD